MTYEPPRWVKLIYNIIAWVDDHPIYLLPAGIRFWRFGFYDDYCLCEHCQERRRKGHQRPGKRV